MGKSSEKEKSIDSKGSSEKGPLFDLLIHDLTGPLSVVSTSAASLFQRESRYGPLTDQQKRLIERILRNVRKAQTLLNEMIEISRSEEGLFQKEFFPIEEIVKESLLDVLEIHDPQMVEKLSSAKNLGESRPLLEDRGIFITITGKYCQAPFCHDHKKVQQILRNLFSNAMKYRRSRVEVCISGDIDLCISFEDDGVGIPVEEQDAIFDRFVRLKEKRHTGIPGLGLGLTGVKALLEAMRGDIAVISREGTGVRFVVRIPPLPSQ
jgi:two-component system phosphate regulon sensor histidine kinase PhoR